MTYNFDFLRSGCPDQHHLCTAHRHQGPHPTCRVSLSCGKGKCVPKGSQDLEWSTPCISGVADPNDTIFAPHTEHIASIPCAESHRPAATASVCRNGLRPLVDFLRLYCHRPVKREQIDMTPVWPIRPTPSLHRIQSTLPPSHVPNLNVLPQRQVCAETV